jgi:hypothetical protein
MIDITSWPAMAKLILLLSPFVIGVPGVAISAYTTLTKDYDVVCSSITSNPYFQTVKGAWGNSGFKWRWMLVCTVSGLVAFPWVELRAGRLDLNELTAFPLRLKRRLVLSACLSLGGAVWMLVIWALVKYK